MGTSSAPRFGTSPFRGAYGPYQRRQLLKDAVKRLAATGVNCRCSLAPITHGGYEVENPALYNTICQQPAEDTPRLVYADWLDENASNVGVEEEAYLAHAELIRLQIAVARGPWCAVCKKTGTFRGKWQEWCALTGAPVEGTDVEPDKDVEQECTECDYKEAANRVRWLLKSKYPVASRIGQPMRIAGEELWRPHALLTAKEYRYSRGFVGLVSYTMSSYLKCAKKLCACAPLESIVLCDRTLLRPYLKVGYFYEPRDFESWEKEEGGYEYPRSVIPEYLFDLCTAFRDKDMAEDSRDAYKWLSWAALHFSRKLGGLPTWIPRPEYTADGAPTPVYPKLKDGLPEIWFDKDGKPRNLVASHLEDGEFAQKLRDRDAELASYKRLCAYYFEDVFDARVDSDAFTPNPLCGSV